MIMQKMPPGKPYCLIYSLAMVLNEEGPKILKELGHDGTEVFWPKYKYPLNLRGVHIQEAQDVCLARGKILAPLEVWPQVMPASGDMNDIKRIPLKQDIHIRLNKAVRGRPAILTGRNFEGQPHAVAWDGVSVYDPIGKIYSIIEFNVDFAWILVDIPEGVINIGA